jgi:hypothetical protein
MAAATRKSLRSVPHWPTNEIPGGNPSSPSPVGKLIAGRPASDAGTVKISWTYESSELSVPSPSRGGAVRMADGCKRKSTVTELEVGRV